MNMLNASGVDDAIDTDLVRPAPMMGETGNSLRRVATAVAATLALVGAEVAQADIVVLPTGVNSMTLSGNFYGPTSTGGVGIYTLFNDEGIEFTGESVLGAPVEGGIYTIILNAIRDTGEKLDMVMEFSDLRYTGPQSFEAGSSSLLQSNLLLGINATQNTPWTQAGWDNDGIGQAAVYYGNARMANAVPEPGTTTLLLAGLAGVAGAAAARRRRDTLGVQTPRTDTTPTPEAATAE